MTKKITDVPQKSNSFKKRIEQDRWEMPAWMEDNFLHLFGGYSKEDVERHVNMGEGVNIKTNAPLALQCVATKEIVRTLQHIHDAGVITKPKYEIGDTILATNTRKKGKVFERAEILSIKTTYYSWQKTSHVHRYRVRLERKSDLGNVIDLNGIAEQNIKPVES